MLGGYVGLHWEEGTTASWEIELGLLRLGSYVWGGYIGEVTLELVSRLMNPAPNPDPDPNLDANPDLRPDPDPNADPNLDRDPSPDLGIGEQVDEL